MSNATNNNVTKKKAGAFDIRNVIGALIGLYGLVLILAYLALDPGVNPDTGMDKEPIYNLYTGIALLVVAVVFFIWEKLRPTVVEQVDDSAAVSAVDKSRANAQG